MGVFKALEGQVGVIVESGLYKQADLFVRDGYLYAKSGVGFVRLYADGSTSKAKCRIDALHVDVSLRHDSFGRLCDATVTGSKALTDDKAQLLIGGPA